MDLQPKGAGMNITIAIPTGQRTEQAVEVVRAWQKVGVHVVVFTWDPETRAALMRERTWDQRLKRNLFVAQEATVDKLWLGDRASFGRLQNYMAANTPDWDVLICGADDLWPDKGTELISRAAQEVPGTILWAGDGLFNEQPTHPIITRGWYDKYRQIFDEGFRHNFVDTDLFLRASKRSEVVDCRSFIQFDHRHPAKTGNKKDALYRYGDKMFPHDKAYFNMKHSGNIALLPIRTLEIEDAA